MFCFLMRDRLVLTNCPCSPLRSTRRPSSRSQSTSRSVSAAKCAFPTSHVYVSILFCFCFAYYSEAEHHSARDPFYPPILGISYGVVFLRTQMVEHTCSRVRRPVNPQFPAMIWKQGIPAFNIGMLLVGAPSTVDPVNLGASFYLLPC